MAVYASAFIVHQNEQALVLRFGEPKRVVTAPGLNWKLPLVDAVEIYDKRILDLDSQPQEVTASDQKRLVVDSYARYKIVDPLKFYQTLRYEEGVKSRLGPIIDSAMRRVLGSSTFQDVVRDKREDLMSRIAKQVNKEGNDFGLEVVDVRIKRADLPEQNSKSVFDRMRAERQREAAEFRAQGAAEANRIKATADREATVILAEATRKGEEMRGGGDAERNKIYADAYTRDPEFFEFYRSMQAYEKGIKSADTRLLISPDSDFFKYFTDPHGKQPAPQLRCSRRGNERSRRRLRSCPGDRGPALGPRSESGGAVAGSGGERAAEHAAHRRVELGAGRARAGVDYPRLRRCPGRVDSRRGLPSTCRDRAAISGAADEARAGVGRRSDRQERRNMQAMTACGRRERGTPVGLGELLLPALALACGACLSAMPAAARRRAARSRSPPLPRS